MILVISLSSAAIVATVLHYILDVARNRDDHRLTARILRTFINEVTKDNLEWRISSVKEVADFLDPQKPQSKETK